jgi:hypothetical protein
VVAVVEHNLVVLDNLVVLVGAVVTEETQGLVLVLQDKAIQAVLV